MRLIITATGGLVATLLLPLLLIAALLGGMSGTARSAPTSPGAAQPFTGSGTGCTEPDPTGGRCLTPAARHAHDEIVRVFGAPGPSSAIRSATCWDAHAWNPGSDHPRGRACDYFPGVAGIFPTGRTLDDGWRIAGWLRDNAATLQISYVIWQGRFWSPTTADVNGWGRPYTGGGVYDATDVTGGHFDHLHVSTLV